jgi:hypothetical protein
VNAGTSKQSYARKRASKMNAHDRRARGSGRGRACSDPAKECLAG